MKAMKLLGISREQTAPVLQRLVKLYDYRWELIEAESYRALADAIFDEQVPSFLPSFLPPFRHPSLPRTPAVGGADRTVDLSSGQRRPSQ